MATAPTAEQIMHSVLQWPTEKRLQLLDVLHASLIDTTIDHGPDGPAAEVEAG